MQSCFIWHISYKFYVESKAKQAISLKRLVMYDVEILWRFEHIILSTDSILNTSNNSDIYVPTKAS